jgi:hypothetical protein
MIKTLEQVNADLERQRQLDAHEGMVKQDMANNAWRYWDNADYTPPTPEHDAQRQRIDDVIKNL